MILHSQIIGEGTPFVILHGFLGMSDNWRTLGRKFAEQGYQMHLVDQRNHGRSFHHPEFSYRLMADDLLAYCDHHQLDRIVLLGHSMGGKTAMQFAVDHPSRVEKLIVADIAPKSYPQHHQDILKGLSELDFNVIASRGEADTALSHYVKEMGTRQFLLKNLYWKEKGQLGLRINLPVLAQEVAAVGEALAEETTFEGPTLFVRGGTSGYIEDWDQLSISKHFPKAILETVAGAGHWVHAENPTEFYRIVMEFL